MLITAEEKEALYKTIFNRRDVRSEFNDTPIPDEVIARILKAAHHAPSVGFMQPWDFIVIKNKPTKQRIKAAFEIANKEAAKLFDGEKQKLYKSLKLEGILEAPLGICITCDKSRSGDVVLGRTANKEMDLYSTVCAVQNLWLAARAENLGVGWVSIIHNKALQEALNIPEHITPVAYLCVGYVDSFQETPELEKVGWRKRVPIEGLIHYEQWGEQNNALKNK